MFFDLYYLPRFPAHVAESPPPPPTPELLLDDLLLLLPLPPLSVRLPLDVRLRSWKESRLELDP